MISSIAHGASGMRLAADRFEASASRVARFGTELGPDVDIASEMIEVIEAKAQYKASAKVVGIASDLARTTLDILV